MTTGQIALLAAFGVLALAIVFAVRSGGGARKDPAAKPGDGGFGWIVLAMFAGLAVLVIGTCNTFFVPGPKATPPAPPRARRPPVPAPPAASPTCEDALREADRTFAALGLAQAQHRAAAAAADRACRVEAAPADTDAAPASDAGP